MTEPGATVVPRNLYTHAWCAATGGALARHERREVLLAILRDYPTLTRDLYRLVTGRGRPAHANWVVPSADEELLGIALTACEDQGPHLQGHGVRTWMFGQLLAGVHGVEVDADELLVASVAHDVGLSQAVASEDFTIRSGQAAVDVFRLAGRPLDRRGERRVRDAVVAHCTPGVDPVTSPLGWAVQAGAVADLVGLGLADLPDAVIDLVYEHQPQAGFREVITAAIAAEADAVPRGRFALLRRTGFNQAVALAPHRDR